MHPAPEIANSTHAPLQDRPIAANPNPAAEVIVTIRTIPGLVVSTIARTTPPWSGDVLIPNGRTDSVLTGDGMVLVAFGDRGA